MVTIRAWYLKCLYFVLISCIERGHGSYNLDKFFIFSSRLKSPSIWLRPFKVPDYLYKVLKSPWNSGLSLHPTTFLINEMIVLQRICSRTSKKLIRNEEAITLVNRVFEKVDKECRFFEWNITSLKTFFCPWKVLEFCLPEVVRTVKKGHEIMGRASEHDPLNLPVIVLELCFLYVVELLCFSKCTTEELSLRNTLHQDRWLVRF